MTAHDSAGEPSAVRTHEAAALDAAIDDLLAGGISWRETAHFAFETLRTNPVRTLLTALGVLIGVAAVIALLAIGRGSQESITSSITANGANLITLRPGASTSGGVRGAVGESDSLTMNDAEALADPLRAPNIALVSPEYAGSAQLVTGSNNANARVTGATPVYAEVHNTTVEEGGFLSEAQNRSAENVVILGATIATTLFPDGGAVGEQVRLNGQNFTVIGVLKSSGGTGFGSVDDGVIVPLTTAQRKLFGARAIGGSWSVSTIVVQATSAETVDAAAEEVATILREDHSLPADGSGDTFSAINQQTILETVTQTTQLLTLFLGAIAAISLLVGGIGIMNIMLVSVRERTREIGLRKALGAKEGDILLQFLFESLALSGVGGLAGLILGSAIALSVNLTGLVTVSLSWDVALLAFGFALAVGLFFGIAPARSAARLDPIVALRYE
ncbi:ABC transporter permease [Candidatus Chloroploca sp. M-50]|uniref:ABC transporter permease n=1 Tax=Candidatus Chloroploca mongolica TaxID=2528176 RepID=A0ABS4D702_9CHLR|nr:ABC transporter permease [Candidatus Chloroploca mongolica]MBP1465218.1 ABC transporter permease [Candidatus Chloroploca mongolica]